VSRARKPEHPLLLNERRDVVLASALLAGAAVVFVLIAIPSTKATVQRWDDAFLRLMVDSRSAPLTFVAKVFNFLGLTYVTLPVRILVAGYLAFRRRWWHFAGFVSAIVVSELCIGPVKALYDRARPPGSLVATSGASFPSGHALAASVTVVAIVIALFPPRHRGVWGLAAVVFSSLMGLSRAYLAAHWLSDAVAGVLLGSAIAMWCAIIVQWIRERRDRRRSAGTGPPAGEVPGDQSATSP
jgi:undecaprenyl-diphosphatase